MDPSRAQDSARALPIHMLSAKYPFGPNYEYIAMRPARIRDFLDDESRAVLCLQREQWRRKNVPSDQKKTTLVRAGRQRQSDRFVALQSPRLVVGLRYDMLGLN